MKIINSSLMVLAMLVVTISVQAQTSWTYVDTWWEVRSNNKDDEIEQDNGFLLVMDGHLILNAKVVTEVNAESNSHGFTHGVAITDIQSNTTIAEKTDTYLYTGEQTSYTTFLSYEVPSTEEELGPFEVDLVVAPTGCPESHCNSCGGGGGGWSAGISYFRYDYSHISIDGKIWFEHYGNHCSGNNCSNCPTTCRNSSAVTEYVQVRCIGHKCTIGARARIQIPYGPAGCLFFGIGNNHNSTILQCYDLSYN